VVKFSAVAVLAACVVSLAAARHPLHTTITEIRYRPATRTAAVSVRAFEDDLTPVTGRDDAGVVAYVGRQIRLRERDGQVASVRWEGVTRRDALLWITGQATLRHGFDGATVENRMLTERFEDQVNVVRATDGRRRLTLLFTRGDGPKLLR
jgi:hypothetical protein